MNLYKQLTGLGYEPSVINYRTTPHDESRFLSLEEINLANLCIRFKSIGVVEGGRTTEEVKAENSIVASVVYGEGAGSNKFGLDNIIATDKMILAHPTSLSSGDSESVQLVNEVYNIIGDTNLSNLENLTGKQAAALTGLGFILLLDVNQL